jgi:hypothetical protein
MKEKESMTTGWLLLKVLKEKLSNLKENLKRFDMEFAIGFFTGALIMWVAVYFIVKKWEKNLLEKLKDFETWKEWKNKQQ